LVALGVPFAVLLWWPHEHIIRYAGLGLQLAGIGSIWWEIRETRKLFEHPTFWMQAREWFRRRPKYGGRVIAAGGSVAAAATVSARATVWSHAGADATLEKRVETLEKNLRRVRDDLSSFEKKTEDGILRQYQAIKQEQQARHRSDQELREKMKTTETGGFACRSICCISKFPIFGYYHPARRCLRIKNRSCN
jgi:hypothetical protein